MVISIIVILVLAWQTIHGYRLGFTKRIVRLVGLLVTFLAASFLNTTFGDWLIENIAKKALTSATAFDTMFYRFIAFFLIMLLGRFVVHLLTRLVPTSGRKKGIISWVDGLLGALVSFIVGYFVIYLVLSMLNALQLDWFIQQTIDSNLLQFILYETPGLSQNLFNNIFGLEPSSLNLS